MRSFSRAAGILCLGVQALTFGQPRSAIQFYDSTGSAETAALGWSGTTETGKFHIDVPAKPDIVKIENGQMTVEGAIGATEFRGSGSGLTDLPSHTHSGTELTDGTMTPAKLSTAGASSGQVLTNTSTGPAWQGLPAAIAEVSAGSGLTGGGSSGSVKIALDTAGATAGEVLALTSSGPAWQVAQGDIAAVTAGTGLTGGGNSGSVVVALDTAGATAGQILAITSSGPAWQTETGDIAAVSAGTGLTGGGSSGSVNVSLDTIGASLGQVLSFASTGPAWQDLTYPPLGDTMNGELVISVGSSRALYAEGSPSGGDIITVKHPSSTKVTSYGLLNDDAGGYGYVGLGGSGRYITQDKNALIVANAGASQNGINFKLGTTQYMRLSNPSDDGLLEVSGSITYTGSVTQASDQRFKGDIRPMENCLDRVLELEPVDFSWRREEFPQRGFPKDRQVGLVAQQTEKHVPEIVETAEDGYKSIDYARMSVVLVQAMKEQQQLIESQQQQIAQLQQEVRAMKKELTR